ncbi:putative RNA methyltransferase [Shewanella surugensis]|uniref:Methyltransferase domain-containing protein n=1 Tax=Shewanella surugensis TaxID=212020 RepID=A0ABT0L638_9GAMM|nr:methyltransferase domain-containing protein [Shewanella surugensis]MCL1123152.1 methyltransferase domain-containing protein [Shewanella surugensis]
MKSIYLCPTCTQPLWIHQASQGLYCENKHHFDKSEQGYWIFSVAKKPKLDSRQVMRAKRYLLESGVFSPLIKTMGEILSDCVSDIAVLQQAQLTQLDFDCGEGFYMRALASQLNIDLPAISLVQTGIAEAENALFAAAKSAPSSTYITSHFKSLPFADSSFDLVTLIDKPLKGKELPRVLKNNGVLLQVIPAPRHLWQIKSHIYTDLTEKALDLSVPSGFELLKSQRVAFTLPCTGEQALTLLDMTPYAWRVSEKVRKKIGLAYFDTVEIDFVVNLMVKTEDLN